MRYPCFNCLLALATLLFVVLPSRGEDVPNRSRFPEVQGFAVIDVSQVFTEYRPFRHELEELKREAKFTADTQSGIRCGSVTYLDVPGPPKRPIHHGSTGMSKKEFLTREAELYRVTYSRMQREIAEYCQANDIQLVLRTEDFAHAKEVGGKIQREGVGVFWADDVLDITEEIITRMNGESED